MHPRVAFSNSIVETNTALTVAPTSVAEKVNSR